MKSENHYWHNLSAEKTAEILKTDTNKGISEEEVVIRRKQFGPNKLPEEKPLSQIKIFLGQFRSPLIYILIIAGIITLILKEWTDTIVIFFAVILNTIVGYIQENKASNALRELKKVLKVKAICFREGREKEILQEDLVRGDIIILKAGDKVPADGRIIKSSNLRINEASLTGEWLADAKYPRVLSKQIPVADRENMVYMGTIVEDGEGRAVITGTGPGTEIGRVAALIRETREEKTPYQKKLSYFSAIVGIIITFICLFIFIEGVAKGREFLEMFTTAVAVAVAAIPEGLPVAMTVILALGMQRILKKKGLVRKLAAAETLGSTSIICTDKTLTLTQGKMEVSEIMSKDKTFCLKIAVLCNEAFIENPQAPGKSWKIRGRPTDRALILAGEKMGLLKPDLEKKFPKIDEIPFNSQNKFIATIHQGPEENFFFVSGAPEKIINLSSKIKKKKEEMIGKSQLLELNRDLEDLTGRGLRVIAVAYKKTREKKLKIKESMNFVHLHPSLSLGYLKNLTFVGFIALKDPLRKDTKKAVEICRKAGMKPIIVTGDHLLTAWAVARELDLNVKKENIIEGKDLDRLSDREFQERINKIYVYARVEPRHKLRIIHAWQDRKEVVAMTGDGINDAPALKKADIGIALGSGTEVAKEVSDLVLLNDNFSIIIAAVEEGRAILDNIRKVITYLLSDSFTEVVLVGVSIIFGWPLPIAAAQILWVNLIEDGLPGIALAFEPKEKDLMEQKPGGHKVPLLTREMKALIFIIGLITDLLLLGLFFWLMKYSGYEIPHIRSIIFAGLAIDSFFYVFSCKSLRKNLWQINLFSNKFLILAWIFGALMLLSAFYLPPFQTLLKTVPLNLFDWQLILGLGLINIALIEATKYYFIVRHKTNI